MDIILYNSEFQQIEFYWLDKNRLFIIKPLGLGLDLCLNLGLALDLALGLGLDLDLYLGLGLGLDLGLGVSVSGIVSE